MDRKLEDLLKPSHSKAEKMKLDAYSTLFRCIGSVGGDVLFFEKEILEGMTVLELIDSLAPNRVTFTIIK
jgi:hypothetical protein